MKDLKDIVLKFDISEEVKEIKPLGNGLINDTYKVETNGKNEYVLQRINNAIFQDVDLLQNNIEEVTSHIRKHLKDKCEVDIERKVLKFIPLKNSKKTYYFDGEKYWRLSVFIKDAITKEVVNPESSYYAGLAFGNFESILADIPHKLGETIPNFHNMELRWSQLQDAIKENKANRLGEKDVQDIIAELNKYSEEMCKAERLHREGKLPKRICHCDTKVNNMLFDKNNNILCVIDLDTVMPSFIFSDYGDFLRTGANTGAEDAQDLNTVSFNLDIFEAFTKGYLESAKGFLTDIEIENLPYAVCLFPYMQAVRFFADYLNGDTYYKIQYPKHNLVRTQAQLKLFRDILSKQDQINSIIKKYR